MVFFVFKIYLKDLYFRQSFYKPMIHMIRYKKGNVCLDFIKILLIMGIIIACGAYLIAISSWFLNNLVKQWLFLSRIYTILGIYISFIQNYLFCFGNRLSRSNVHNIFTLHQIWKTCKYTAPCRIFWSYSIYLYPCRVLLNPTYTH